VTLSGRRYLDVDVPNGDGTDTVLNREAIQQHPGEMLSGGVTTGAIFDESGTVFTPQVNFDGLAMRQEAYSESGGGNGMDLHVASSYDQSLRAFAGVNVRQDFDFTDFLLQPDITAGYRYDLANGAESLKGNFESVTPVSIFEITGPKPDKGNAVIGGGVAVSTGAWSLGLNFDYLKAGSGNTAEQGTITLLGRI
jgi:outer membrane autotransporter protein